MRYSLVIGSYNPNLEWLKSALDSAKGLFDEIILVDDGSNPRIPIDFCTENGVTLLVTKMNGGFYTARNAGIERATGDIIASLDDDDEFIREDISDFKLFIEANTADIYHFPIELFGEQSGYWGDNFDLSQILNANQCPSGSWFRKSVWESLGGFQYPKAEDWDFWARAYKKGFKFRYFPLPIYKHRMRKDSLSGDWVGDKFIKIREEVRERYNNYE